MLQVNVHHAKTHLSSLLERVKAGEVVVIAKAGKPIARLVALDADETGGRLLGRDAGLFKVPEDFDAPLPEQVLRAFEGR